MRKFYAPSLMGKSFLFLLLTTFAAFFAQAQVDVAIGTGTTGNTGTNYPTPLQDFYEGSRAQYLYRASELVAAGMGPGNINAIKFNVTNLNTFSGNIEQYTIKIGSTATASLSTSSTVWETTTTVYGPVDYVPALGTNAFTFTTPFFWNGTDNLVIEVCNGLPANTTDGLTHWTNNATVPWTAGLTFNGSHTIASDDAGNLCGSTIAGAGITTTAANRPNATFNWTAAGPCTGTPTAGTATANPSTVCLGQSFTLSVSGGTVASGLVYQWQSSTDNATFTNIAGATSPSLTATQPVTTYYRVIVTCTASGASATSNSVQVTSPALVSGTFAIDKTAPTNPSLFTFNSFNDAYNYIKCGIGASVVFNVKAGTGPYTEQLLMDPVPGTSSTKTVTFNGNGETIQFLSTNTTQRAVIALNGADFIRFNNLVITATGSSTTEYGYGVLLTNDADSNRITNCKINVSTVSTSTNYTGIAINASTSSAITSGSTLCDGNLIDNNVITGGYYGITLVGSSTEAVRQNVITNNTIQEFYFYGLYLLGNYATQVEGNRLTRPTRTAVATTLYGIYVTSLNTLLNITRNRLYNPYGGATTNTGTFYGIYFTGTDALGGLENKVTNNAIYNTNFNGSIYGLYNSSSDNVWYYHNTIVIDGSTTTSGAVARGFYQITAAGGIELKNNLIYISRTGTSANHALYFATAITASNPFISNYNDLVLTTSTGSNYVGYYNSANRATLLDWQTASSQDANSLTVNPIFQAPSSENFAPTNASLDNKGTPITSVTVDINNAPRNATTPDIGAWEFTPGACLVPPTPGATAASTNPVCTGFPVSLTLNGNSIGLGQTYTLQSSATLGGTYTDVGLPRTLPDTVIRPTTTLYYRFAVTCGASTVYSTPVLVSVNQRMPGGTYTIDKNSPTSYPTGTNFVSFNAANNALQCGIAGPVVFNVTAGRTTYAEQLILDTIPGASAINTVTFNGNGNTIKFHSSNDGERAVIKLRRADFVTIDSLTIDATGTNTYGWGVQLINNADSNTVRRCTIITSVASASTNDAGIVVSNADNSATTTGATWCDGNLFERNTITGGYYGITMVGGTGADVLQNNTIRGNVIKDFYFYGMYLYGHNNLTVEGNDISRPTRTATSTFYGIYATTYGTNLFVSKNRIHNPFDGTPATTSGFYGIYFTSVDGISATSPNRVFNNAIYNVNGEGDEYGLYNSSSDYTLYYHNTLSFDNTASNHTTTWWTRPVYQITQADGLQYKNNIISITRGGAGDRHAMYMASAGAFVSSNNDLYVTGNAGTAFTGYYNGNVTTLAAWQTTTGQDATSISYPPLYASPTTGNLTPRNPSLDNKGTPVGVTTDIVNATRSTTTPDIGAWEFAIPACTAPPPAGAASATPNVGICKGAPITLSLTGINTIVSGQTYQWQYSTTASGPWTNLGGLMSFPDTVIEASKSYYYRAVVTCSGQSATSTPALVTLNPSLLGGYYTINPTGTGTNNFTSFAAAASALACGIEDDVWFAAVPGTYTEQVRIGKVPGASDTARVTFMSQSGNPASVILTYAATSANNYTLRLDSSSFVTFRDLTINATDATNGRAVDIAGTSGSDSLANLVINVPVTTSTGTTVAGIYGSTNTSGQKNVIRKNTISNGSAGIYYVGSGASQSNRIDSNTVNNPYYYGIYFSNSAFSALNNNTVNRAAPTNTTAYSIYALNLDSAYEVVGNRVNSSGLSATQYGMYLSSLDAANTQQGKISNNRITVTGATGTVYGMYQTGNTFNYSLNNVISVATSGSSYALYSSGGGDIKYYNNSVNNASSGTTSYAGYFIHTSGSGADVRNTIFAANGGGVALYNSNPGYVSGDYNMYYTSGSTLFQLVTPAAATYNNLAAWILASGWDQNSIVYKPAFNSNTDLSPKLTDSTVWAMHGRGVQIAGNNADVNNASRPTTLTTGVPDLGAFEFLPTVPPMPLQGTPVAPAANTTQVFMFGTDTVAKISWKATVPSAIALRRYSGVLPTGTSAGQNSMYFYTKADVTGTATPNYDLTQFYIDPWQGFIPREAVTRLGRTNAAGTWLVDAASRVDTVANVISRDTLNYIDRFTGLTDATIAPPPPPVYVQQVDSSNRGKRFWVAYAHSYDFYSGGNAQDMVLYLGAGSQPATVTVRITGTNWVRTYNIPANTAISSAVIPKTGLNDARLLVEGLTPRGILIESNVDISAYAHIYYSTNSGATMLLPVGVYGYEYYTLNSRQYYTSTNSYSSFFVVADRDNTKVEITPSAPTYGGKPAGVPFTVTLNAGEVYQVLGAYLSAGNAEGYDLTGSLIKSVPNSAGKCYPIAVFAGSTRTSLGCGTSVGGGGDLLFQQVFPSQAWGTKYLTAPTSLDVTPSSLMTNMFRVMVKDPTTVVQRNGTTLTGLIGNRYYQYESNTADYVTADKPVMVAQYMASSGSCPNTSGDGDPELFYLSPIEQAVKESPFYRNTLYAINVNYVTLIVPTAGVSSLRIDGSNTFDYTYPVANRPGYTVVVKKFAAGAGYSYVKCDSAFTGIVYGMGSVESYGYNVGTLVKNLNALPSITNTLGTTGTSSYTCANTPFRFYILLPLKPTLLTWQFSQVSGLSPNADIVQTNPAVLDSTLINGRWYYRFTVAADYTFSGTGAFNVPIVISHPTIEGCSNSFERLLTINVVAAPVTDFAVAFTGCLGDVAQFSGAGTSAVSGISTTAYNWNFGDNTTATGQTVSKTYAAAGTFNTKLNVITADGCLGERIKPVVVNPRPTVTLVSDSVTTCPNVAVPLQVQNPATGATYNWYTTATGGTPVFTGTTYNVTVTANTVFYVEAVQAGCSSTSRRRAVVAILPNLAAPVVQVINAQSTPNSLTWGWTAVPNATGYEVSTNNGVNWTAPSSGSGPSALTHTIAGLQPLTSVTLLVRALGGCLEARSQPVTGKTLTDQVYIPNSFSPNGDGLNDVLKVYGYVIRNMQFTVFNQWGEKIFESRSQSSGWDGTYKSKMQPSGVYIYVARFTLNDGSALDMKGTINLVR